MAFDETYSLYLLGARHLLNHSPDYEHWNIQLGQLDSWTNPGVYPPLDEFFAEFAKSHSDPVLVATAETILAGRLIRQANAVTTPHDQRTVYAARARALTHGLSDEILSELFVNRAPRAGEVSSRKPRTFAEQKGRLVTLLDSLIVGQTVPDIQAPNLKGQVESLQQYRGKVVLLDFWATWCSYCVASMPKLLETYQALPSDQFELLSISIDKELTSVQEFQQHTPMPLGKLAYWPGQRHSQAIRYSRIPYLHIDR